MAGCSFSPDSQYYVLSIKKNEPLVSWEASSPNILIGPISVPEYLKRNKIIYRNDSSKVDVKEYDWWAESIDTNITDVLTRQVSRYLTSDTVFSTNSNFVTRPDLIVRIDVSQFALVQDKLVVLEASWEIQNRDTGTSEIKASSFQVSSLSNEIADVVDAMSQAINDLGRAISEHLIESV